MPAERKTIDDFLPEFELAAKYEIAIRAPAHVVYECLLHADFSQSRLIRTLMALRSGRRSHRAAATMDLRQRLRGTGFVELAEIPGQEIVIGVAGKFWRPDGGRCMDLTADGFVGFCLPGYTKAAWNFTLAPASGNSTILATETRIRCFGRGARWKFQLYWILVGPFSGLIRKVLLKQIKVAAESKSGDPASAGLAGQ
ncbi:MAG TPA: hypothetical protein VNV88_10960 [Candidatus Solibacter sp.]|jgi:hypothetical protein|nr:hypothetical protein [Candidatus Solibacter sp.]